MFLVQHTPEWHAFRLKHVGSTDIAAIVGLNPRKTAYDVWLEKTGRTTDSWSNEAMRYGTEKEPEARSAYIDQTGDPVMPDVCEHPEHKFCGASLDGISFDRKLLVEIKCPSGEKTYDFAKKRKLAPYYQCQVQWQLFVTGADKCDFVVRPKDYPARPLIIVEVLPDKEMQTMLLQAAVEFWPCVVEDREPGHLGNQSIMITTEGFDAAAERWKASLGPLKDAQIENTIAKEALLEETDGGNCFGCGVQITFVESSEIVDWAAVKENFNLTDEDLKPYKKKKAPYFRVSLLKERES